MNIDAGPAGAGRVPFSHAIADLIEPFRPPILSFHFGLPMPDLLARVKAWGVVVLSSATTVVEARWLQTRGADALIAQVGTAYLCSHEAHNQRAVSSTLSAPCGCGA